MLQDSIKTRARARARSLARSIDSTRPDPTRHGTAQNSARFVFPASQTFASLNLPVFALMMFRGTPPLGLASTPASTSPARHHQVQASRLRLQPHPTADLPGSGTTTASTHLYCADPPAAPPSRPPRGFPRPRPTTTILPCPLDSLPCPLDSLPCHLPCPLVGCMFVRFCFVWPEGVRLASPALCRCVFDSPLLPLFVLPCLVGWLFVSLSVCSCSFVCLVVCMFVCLYVCSFLFCLAGGGSTRLTCSLQVCV